MFHVTALGEALIDFTESGKSEWGQRLFEQNPGGAPANFLTALSRLGAKTAFIGKIGDDSHGAFLKEVLVNEHICCKGLIVDPRVFTTMAFVNLDQNGERSFSFARKPGADTQLRPEEINLDLIRDSMVFHFGSLSLTDQPARSAVWKALEEAKANNVLVSYDPNYRPLLWKNEQTAIIQMQSVLHLVDLLKVSYEEAVLLTGKRNCADAANTLLQKGPSLVVVTKGAEGAELFTKRVHASVQGTKTDCKDTTGAGDCFWGSFIYCFIQNNQSFNELTKARSEEFLEFANAAASLCIAQRGGIPSMPTIKIIQRRLSCRKLI